MQKIDGWYFPNGETHLMQWMANPKVRMILNGKPAYQGAKQVTAMGLCKNFRTAVDVGGHIGLHSFNMAHRFASVVAFEPVVAHRACFVENTKPLTNITLVDCALGERPGRVSIRTEPTSSGDSRVTAGDDVEMRTLDSFNLQDVDYLKLDTEGHELFVLRGAVETLARCKPVVMVEQKPGHAQRYGVGEKEAVPFLQAMGYKMAKEMSGDFLMYHPGA